MDCGAGVGATLTGAPSGFVQHGTVISYTATFTVSAAQCDVDEFTATLFRPNGVSTEILTLASIPSGSSIVCPGGAGCAAGPYQYTVAHANETGPITGCPPAPSGPTSPKQVTAYVQGNGTAHGVVHESASACATKGNPVNHTPIVTTEVHNAAHTDITSGAVKLGDSVHDEATVSAPEVDLPIPQGTVDFTLFATLDCQPEGVSKAPRTTWRWMPAALRNQTSSRRRRQASSGTSPTTMARPASTFRLTASASHFQ